MFDSDSKQVHIRGQLQNEIRPVAQGVERPVGFHSATGLRASFRALLSCRPLVIKDRCTLKEVEGVMRVFEIGGKQS